MANSVNNHVHRWLLAGGVGTIELDGATKGVAELVNDVVKGILPLILESQILLRNFLEREVNYNENTAFTPLLTSFTQFVPFDGEEGSFSAQSKHLRDKIDSNLTALFTDPRFDVIEENLGWVLLKFEEKRTESLRTALELIGDSALFNCAFKETAICQKIFRTAIRIDSPRHIKFLFNQAEEIPLLMGTLVTTTSDEDTVFHLAIQSGSVESAKQVLYSWPQGQLNHLLRSDEMGRSPLSCVASGPWGVAQPMIKELATCFFSIWSQLVAPDKSGNTPLHWASMQRDDGRIQALFDTVKDYTRLMGTLILPNKLGQSAFYTAASCGRSDVITTLFRCFKEFGLDLNFAIAPDKIGNTPLHWSMQNNSENRVIEVLFTHLPKEFENQLIQPNRFGETSLHLATMRGTAKNIADLFKYWPENKMDLLIQSDLKGNNALHYWAGGYGYKGELDQLVSSWSKLPAIFAHLTQQNIRGRTPLHVAVFQNNGAAVNTLMQFFASDEHYFLQLFSKDRQGHSPFDMSLRLCRAFSMEIKAYCRARTLYKNLVYDESND